MCLGIDMIVFLSNLNGLACLVALLSPLVEETKPSNAIQRPLLYFKKVSKPRFTSAFDYGWSSGTLLSGTGPSEKLLQRS